MKPINLPKSSLSQSNLFSKAFATFGEEIFFTTLQKRAKDKPYLEQYRGFKTGEEKYLYGIYTEYNRMKTVNYTAYIHLTAVFAYLMMLAFLIDQIQQSSCQYFKLLLQELKTKVKLWESLRAVFKILPCKNMMQIFFCIADMYQIRLE